MTELKTYYYTDGTAVRKPEIEYYPNGGRFTKERREREKREEALRQQKRHHRRFFAVHRRNKLMTAYMTMIVFIACSMFVGYVSLQNSITTKLNRIAYLETELNEVKADNKAAESRIATAVNLNDIKGKAINELGMVYATSSQIVYYSMDNVDYMNQYADIP